MGLISQSVCLNQLNSGKVVAVGPGVRDANGNLIPVAFKEGDLVLLPEYGGTEVKLSDKEYAMSSFTSPLKIFIF